MVRVCATVCVRVLKEKLYKIPIELRRCQCRWFGARRRSSGQFMLRTTRTHFGCGGVQKVATKGKHIEPKTKTATMKRKKTCSNWLRRKIDFANTENPNRRDIRTNRARDGIERRARPQMRLLFRWCLHINLLVRQLKIFVKKLLGARKKPGRQKRRASRKWIPMIRAKGKANEVKPPEILVIACNKTHQPHPNISIFGRSLDGNQIIGFNKGTTPFDMTIRHIRMEW